MSMPYTSNIWRIPNVYILITCACGHQYKLTALNECRNPIDELIYQALIDGERSITIGPIKGEWINESDTQESSQAS